MDRKIKKGDKYLCIKDYEMEDGSVDFTTAYQYKVKSVNEDGESVIFIDDDNDEHQISFKDLGEYFKLSSTVTQDSGTISVTNTKDNINPDHYKIGGIETIDYMKAKSTPEEFKGHLRLTAIKYLSRYGQKDDTLQEIKKAQWYVNRLVEELENE